MFSVHRYIGSVLAIATLSACGGSASTASTTTTPGTSAPAATRATTNAALGAPRPGEPVFEARAVSPLTYSGPLQIVSIFPYEANETLLSPATEIAGFLGDARTKSGFGKEPVAFVDLTTPPKGMQAKELLAIAWGPRADFSIERAKKMGHVAMTAALSKNVDEAAYAPIARDQGVTTIAADDVAAAFVEGALAEFLAHQKVSNDPATLRRFTYEAGPPFVDAVAKAVARGVAAAHAQP